MARYSSRQGQGQKKMTTSQAMAAPGVCLMGTTASMVTLIIQEETLCIPNINSQRWWSVSTVLRGMAMAQLLFSMGNLEIAYEWKVVGKAYVRDGKTLG